MKKLFFGLLITLSLQLNASEESNQTAMGAQELRKIDQKEQANIFRHRDTYIISGVPDTKVQLSFKLMPVINFPIYFGYTQLMFWELGKDSKPFQDINFNPELYYDWNLQLPWLQSIAGGIEHRSNGKAEIDSRSLDQLFIALSQQIGYGTFRFAIAARFFLTYDIDWQTNRDIRKFSGFSSARISLDGITEKIFPSKGDIYVNILPGGTQSLSKGHGALEFNIKYRMGRTDVMPYLLFQYYFGYMESLLKYDTLTRSYRIGMSF